MAEMDDATYDCYEQYPRQMLTARLYSALTEENKAYNIKMGGLPFTICKHEIIDFFFGFEVKH